jgi:chloride channel protein, CIC family
VGATAAYITNGLLAGWQPFFSVPDQPAVDGLASLLPYIAFGALAGLAGVLLPRLFHRTRRFFDGLALWPPLKPALGGLAVGLLGLALPQLFGGGYGWMQEIL